MIDEDMVERKNGNQANGTKVRGSYHIEFPDDGVGFTKARVDIYTKKLGVTGSGTGRAVLVFLKVDATPFFVLDTQKNVGADFFDGIEDGTNSSKVSLLPPITNQIGGLYFDVDLDDSLGFPTNLNELIDAIGNLNARLESAGLPNLNELAIGQKVFLGDGIVGRLK